MTSTISAEVDLADPGDQNDVAARLRALADEERLSGRSAQLRRLADDLANESGLERWAEIDLYAAFLRDDTIEARARPPLRRAIGTALDLLPAILIFLPIVVTWIGLYNATLAYRQSRGDPNLVGKSFLEQWQTGFDHRLSERLYFDRIALWTLFGIGLLVAVSLAQALLRRRADRLDAMEHATLTRRLATALTDADFQLSRYRLNDASRLELGSRQLVEAADRVSRAGEVAQEIQREARDGLREVRESLDRVRELADALLTGEQSVRAAGERLGDAVTGIGTRLDEVSAASGSVATAAADLSRSVSADSAGLRQAVEQAVTSSTEKMRTAVGESQRDAAARLAGALDGSATSISRALDEWRQEGAMYSHRHETAADHLGQVVGSIERLMDRVARSLDRLPAVVDRFEARSAETAQRMEQNTTEAAERLVADLTKATDRLKKHLDRLVAGLPDADPGTQRVVTQMAALEAALDRLRERLGGRRRFGRRSGRAGRATT
ncbi:MAG TPA: hypothetical protein VF069_16170 [Streptosporangiaceae bacterium]